MLPGESSCPGAGGSEYVWQNGVGGLWGRVTGSQSWPSFQKKSPTLRCNKKLCLPQFSTMWRNCLSGQALFRKLREIQFFVTPHIFTNGSLLSPSTDFGWSKHSQNCSAANFRQQGVWSLMHSHHLTFYDPSQYLSSFPSNCPKSKQILFLTDFLVRLQKKFWARVSFNLMPPTIHIVSLNRFTPN